MRSLLLATVAGLGLALAGPAMAQHAAPATHGGGQWRGGGQWHGGQWHGNQGQGHWSGGGHRHDWGGRVGGRWIGGARAPGGWSAYRRPVRGWALPGYWLAPSFYITDWSDYGLGEPPYGYHWSRYYDDAVLVDQYGRVMDCTPGIDWGDGYDQGDDYDYSHDVGPGAGYPPPPRVETRTYGYGGPPPPPVVVQQGPGCGCGVGGWYYPAPTVTTVTITSQPVVTTTREVHYVEESVPVHHFHHVWHAPSKYVPRTRTKYVRRPSKLTRR